MKNFRSLYEWEIDARKLEELKGAILEHPDVKKIGDQSGVYIGIHEIKYSLDVTYDLNV
jgi:hypothetical protein